MLQIMRNLKDKRGAWLGMLVGEQGGALFVPQLKGTTFIGQVTQLHDDGKTSRRVEQIVMPVKPVFRTGKRLGDQAFDRAQRAAASDLFQTSKHRGTAERQVQQAACALRRFNLAVAEFNLLRKPSARIAELLHALEQSIIQQGMARDGAEPGKLRAE